MRACRTGTSCSGNAALPFVAGIACFVAVLCGRFWVLKCLGSSSPVKVVAHEKHVSDVDAGAEEREDRISQLPDDVNLLIISRLDTIEAVRTSILSRRWRHVYTLVREVRFSCCKMATNRCYMCYKGDKLSQLQRELVQRVDIFLQLHSCYKIVSFELVCCFRGCFFENLRKWVNFVGRLGAEQLNLKYCWPHYMRGSNPPVFTSDFLHEALSVKRLLLWGCSFQAPNRNALTILEMDHAALTSEQVESILSNCLSLQSLKFIYCQLPSKLLIYGPNLQLKSLTVYCCSAVAEMDLSAINLIDLQLCGLNMPKLSFSYVPSLQNLYIRFLGGVVPPFVFGKVAKDLPILKCMYFQTQGYFFEGYKIAGVINNLSNLRWLALIMDYPNKLDLLVVASLLDVCPSLHTFHLSMMQQSTFNGKQAVRREVRRHTQLKKVEYSGFRGTKNEYNFISYILKNVVALQQLTIFLHPRHYEINGDRWLLSEENNPRFDKKKQRISRQWLKRQAISKNVDITIV